MGNIHDFRDLFFGGISLIQSQEGLRNDFHERTVGNFQKTREVRVGIPTRTLGNV